MLNGHNLMYWVGDCWVVWGSDRAIAAERWRSSKAVSSGSGPSSRQHRKWMTFEAPPQRPTLGDERPRRRCFFLLPDWVRAPGGSLLHTIVPSCSRSETQKAPVSRDLRWRDPDLNRGHHDFQSCALPTELSRHGIDCPRAARSRSPPLADILPGPRRVSGNTSRGGSAFQASFHAQHGALRLCRGSR